jgi:rubrerythrin
MCRVLLLREVSKMGIFFSGRELIEIAIGVEKNGAIFYDSLAGSSKSSGARNTYKYLAGQEREHAAIFQKMLDSVGESKPPETYTEQYNLYLKALIDSIVFTDDKVSIKMAQNVKNDAEAVQIGMGAEKDSILFYVEVKDLVRRSDRKVVGEIIEEEKSHLRQLTEIKKSL